MSNFKTHYDNLKVARDAPIEVIRAAYRTLTQKYHPDKNASPEAGRIMRVINRAYEVLSDPELRAEHDEWIRSQDGASSASHRERTQGESPRGANVRRAPRAEVNLPKGGSSKASQLPPTIRELVRGRSRGLQQDQELIPLGPGPGNLTFRIVLASLWIVIVVFAAQNTKWSEDTRWIFFWITVVVGAFISHNLANLYRWFHQPFRHALIATQLYIIETTWNRVSYWPISALEDVSAINHHRNGSYSHTAFGLKFHGKRRDYDVKTERMYKAFMAKVASGYDRYNAARDRGDQSIIDSRDDLRGHVMPDAAGQLKGSALLLGAMIAGSLAFAGAFELLAAYNSTKPMSQGSQYSRTAPAPMASSPTYTARPSGDQYAKADKPKQDPIAALIGTDRIPMRASYIKGEPILRDDGLSTVTVDNGKNESDVLVKLVAIDGPNASPIRTFFIPAGGTFTVRDVRPGKYDVRYLDRQSGGRSRSESFDLDQRPTSDGTEFSNMTLTLYKVANGNLQTYSIDESEF